MLTARLLKFAKRDNSTAMPADNAGFAVNIALKEDTNINRPDIIVYLGRAMLPEYNYMYIPDLKRYYFINSWTFIDHVNWMASCSCDVLASYKYDIGRQTQYVVRSASRSDSNLLDMLYPATTDVITQSKVFESPWMDHNEISTSNGSFIVGIDSYDAYYGSVDYFILSSNDLADLCDWLMNDFIQSGGFNTADASIALQRALVNPMQFIKSCMWYPIRYTELISQGVRTTLSVFAYATGITAYKITDNSIYQAYNINLTKLNHPQTDTHGKYVNCSPFTDVSIKLPPFGVIQLDATVLANASGAVVYMWVDLITGKVIAEIKAGVNTLNRISTQLGVPIQLSQVTRNYLGAMTSAAGAVASAASLDFIGAVNGVGNAIQQAAPRVNSIGSNGGFADLYGDVELMYTFYRQADINVVNHGRPLMKYVQIGTLSGYMEVESADILIDCTADERSRIIEYMEGGFYYE